MASTSILLLAQNFKNWVSARGFFLVVLAALIPLLLTGSWVATHQRDVAATAIALPSENVLQDDTVNITARIENLGRFNSGEFNATLAVWNQVDFGRVFDPFTGQPRADAEAQVNRPTPAAENTTKLTLSAKSTTDIALQWTPSSAGRYIVIAAADSGSARNALAQVLLGIRRDDVPELEEFNNLRFDFLIVGFPGQNETFAPTAPGNLTGPEGQPAADVRVENLRWDPEEPEVGKQVTIEVDVTNSGPASAEVNVTLKVGQSFSNQLFGGDQTLQTLTLDAGATQTVELVWEEVEAGPAWAQAYANLTAGASDPNATNNHVTRPLTPDYRALSNFTFPEPSEKITIKAFYAEIIGNIQISMLIPFIALFYAAGVLSDERERGNLAYILTRPVSREMIPAAKFIASFLVSSVALTIGITGTYFLLLGTPNFGAKDVGLFTTPLLISLLALLCYGALFLLVGVVFERPYLTGLLFIAWEWFVAVGSAIQLQGFDRPVLAEWVKNATIYHHLNRAFTTWKVDAGVQWLPADTEPLLWVLGGAFAAIVLSAIVMRTREFDV